MISDHNRINLEINNIKITGKSPNTWTLNNILLNNPEAKEGSFKENYEIF